MVVGIKTFCSHTMLLATVGLLCAKNLYQSLHKIQTAHSVWVNQHQSPKAKTWCVRACLQYEKPCKFTVLFEREAWINFNYSGHIKWNLSKCVGGSTQCCCPEDTAFQHLHFSSCYRVRALFSSTLPSVPLQTFIQASVLPQVHTGDNWRVVETVRRHRCPLWPYQQHSAGVRQPSGQFEVTSVI